MSSFKNYKNQLLGGIGNSLLGKAQGAGGSVLSGAILAGLSDADFYSFFYDGQADPSRNPGSNLVFGARELSEQQLRQQLGQQSNQAASVTAVNPSEGKGINKNFDWRARLRPKGGGADRFYRSGVSPNVLTPIKNSGGLVFQYTPLVYITGAANYTPIDLTGGNYPFMQYQNSTPPRLTITTEFTANNIEEARYMLAVLTFCRVVTKSFYGDQSVAEGTYGTPPPVMLFEYLGDHGFNKVPVVVQAYSFALPDGVDYVPVNISIENKDTTTFVPVEATVTMDVHPYYTPHKLRKKFNLNTMATGQAYKDGFI
jgi:hypothetical protein